MIWHVARAVAVALHRAGLTYGEGLFRIVCSTLHEELLIAVRPDIDWTPHHDALMIADLWSPWSDLEVVVDAGAGAWVELPDEAEPGETYACQRWLDAGDRATGRKPRKGHVWWCRLHRDGSWSMIDATGTQPDGLKRVAAVAVARVSWAYMAQGATVRAVRLLRAARASGSDGSPEGR